MDITPTPVSGFYISTTANTSSPPFIETREDKASLMIEVEPAPISGGRVVSAITQLPPALIQNCDDYLAALSQLSMEGRIFPRQQEICSTAPEPFLESDELPMMVGPLQPNNGAGSSNIPSQQINHSSTARVVPTLFSSNQFLHTTNQGHSGTSVLQQSQINSTYLLDHPWP